MRYFVSGLRWRYAVAFCASLPMSVTAACSISTEHSGQIFGMYFEMVSAIAVFSGYCGTLKMTSLLFMSPSRATASETCCATAE